MLKTLPKAELHVHLEGTISPDKARELANKNNIPIPSNIFNSDGNSYKWIDDGTAASSLVGFISIYDIVSSFIKTADDYTDITYDYLIRSSNEGVIYTELTISADHGAMVGLSYKEMVDAIADGVYKAHKETGIECRLISACVRHFGVEKAINVAKQTIAYPHELVTGFTMAGDENTLNVVDFLPAFKIACEKGGLKATAHAGEAAGIESIRDVKELLGCKRFGHMVRVIEDENFLNEMLKWGAVPEICVSSNVTLKVFKDYEHHPLRKLWQAGFKLVLSSDDPPFFNTSIGKEYEIAHNEFGFTQEELMQITKNSIDAAFSDQETKDRLVIKCQPL